MCGRYALSLAGEDLADFFEIDEVAAPLPGPDYNIAPTDPVVAVHERIRDGHRSRILAPVRWGLVPSWAKDTSGAARLINARAETAAQKPAFRRAFAARRCLLPADGYYEWRPAESAAGKPFKQPYFIRPVTGEPLVMAGLYEYWRPPQGEWLTTVTILTTSAEDELGRLHDRMPLTLARENWSAWLDPELGAEAAGLLQAPVQDLEFFRVSTLVNKVSNDGPELIQTIESAE